MAIRLLATYEFIDKDGNPAGMVRLPVVDYAQPDSDGRERPQVLLLSGDDPHLVDFHPDSTIETQYGRLEALLIDAVADPIPAQPGWVAEIWIEPLDAPPERLGVYPVLAWEPEPNTSFDDAPRDMPSCSYRNATTGSAVIPDRSAPATYRAWCATGARTRPPETRRSEGRRRSACLAHSPWFV